MKARNLLLFLILLATIGFIAALHRKQNVETKTDDTKVTTPVEGEKNDQ